MAGKANRRIRKAAASPAQRAARRAREIGVPEAQIARGGLVLHEVVDLSGELGDGKSKLFQVLLNRGGTAIDRWMANDPRGLFGAGEQDAVRYCQNLWLRGEGHIAAIDPAATRVDCPLGWSQQEALTELAWLAGRVPGVYWVVFENVCRFDQEAGLAGSSIANNSRSAVDAAKTATAFTASLVAMWKRF